LESLDRLNPTIAELTQAIEQELEKCPEAGATRVGRFAMATILKNGLLSVVRPEQFTESREGGS
jgi:hypothetical protein